MQTGFAELQSLRTICEQEIDRLEAFGGAMLTFEDTLYPELLKQIHDPPPVLYTLGNQDLLSSQSIAVVGSRAATSYGKRIARDLSHKLAAHKITVVSGLALGIDTEAHRGALQAGGDTISVLGCGLDVIYPRQNDKLYHEIAEKGVIVTEYPLGTTPEGFRFPARNRIITGLSYGVVVVEAARKSGSLITAQLAFDGGREVFAVPGQVDSYKSEGTHWLLKQGAKLVQSEADVLEEFSGSGLSFTGQVVHDSRETLHVDTTGKLLLDILETYPIARDEILHKSGLDIADFSESLLLLELEGLIEILPGDEVRRI